LERLSKRAILSTRTWGNDVPIRAFLKLPGGYKINIEESPIVVGRKDLVKFVDLEAARYISTNHFVVWCENNKIYIQDGHPLQGKPSTNGTFVNGEDIRGRGAIQLKNGDIIDVAGIVSLSVEIGKQSRV
jgi:pSer/pThr/pTyr-binding forkhead associated (FHA) protein